MKRAGQCHKHRPAHDPQPKTEVKDYESQKESYHTRAAR
jgi:hypothetical protein